MAHLWILDDSRRWTPTSLVGDAVWLDAGGIRQEGAPAISPDAGWDGVVLHRAAEGSSDWALVAISPTARLNGVPVSLGLALLEDRDEIRLPGVTAWFSTEMQARIEPFPAGVARGACPRCRQPIAAGIAAVRCPSCGLWHHASDDLPCWTYASTCAACAQDTAFDAGFRWTPEDL